MNEPNDIYHYGVPGMKWGVRRAINKTTYGMTKSQLKRKITKSPETNRRIVGAKYRAELQKAMKETGLSSRYTKGKLDGPGKEEAYKKWNKEAVKVRREIAKKFVDQFNEARLKDIDYKHVKTGKQMLKDYNMDFKVDDLGIITKGRFATTIY